MFAKFEEESVTYSAVVEVENFATQSLSPSQGFETPQIEQIVR